MEQFQEILRLDAWPGVKFRTVLSKIAPTSASAAQKFFPFSRGVPRVARGSLILAAVREIRGSLTHPVLSIYYYTHNRVAADPRRPRLGCQKIRARSLRGEGGYSGAAPNFFVDFSWGRGHARKENGSNFSPRSADSGDFFHAAGPLRTLASAPGLRARLPQAT